jgi:hypothetical protein
MKRAPLTAAEVESGLKAAGFVQQPGNGTSHVKWIKKCSCKGKPTKFVVIVDAHHAPFSADLTKSMATQAGMSVKQFYELCSKVGQKEAKKGKLKWLPCFGCQEELKE